MSKIKTVSRIVLGLLFVAAGVAHFARPAMYVRLMPPYLPWHYELVILSGVAELVLGLMLLARLRFAAWGLIALLIAVFPANVHMAMHPELFPELPAVALWIRLPIQLLVIAWAYWHTGDGRQGNSNSITS